MTLKANIKNLAVVLTGNFGAQAASLLFYPLLVRLYSPADFGNFGTFTSLMVISSIFCTGQLHLAFTKAQNQTELTNLKNAFKLYCIASTTLVTITLLAINFIKPFTTAVHIALFFPSLLAFCFFESHKMLCISNENFKILSLSTGLNRILSNIIKLLTGLLYPNAVSLIISDITTNIATFFSFRSRTKKQVTVSAIATIKLNSHFPIFASLSSFFQLGLIEVPVIILSLIYDAHEVGVYILIQRIYLQPLAIIGNSIGGITSRRLVDLKNDLKSPTSLLLKIYGGYFCVGLIATGLAAIIPESFFEFLLGGKWTDIQNVFFPLSFLTCAKLSSGIHIYTYSAFNRMKIKSIWKAIQLGGIITLAFYFQQKPIQELLWILCLFEAFYDLVFTIFTVFQMSDKSKPSYK